jgi:hypothetical protein
MALKTVTEINRGLLRYRLGMMGIPIDDGASYYDVYGDNMSVSGKVVGSPTDVGYLRMIQE